MRPHTKPRVLRRRATAPRTAALALLGTLSALGSLGACAKKPEAAPPIGEAVVERRDIVVDAQATGTVEPIEVVEVKSQASGLVLQMPVETGTFVQPGDLIVQIDTRDLKNQLEQAQADLRSSEAALDVAKAQKERSDELFKSRIITAQENEQANLQYTQAQANVIRVRTSVNIAQQRLDEARVTAPVAGTIIAKPVSLGQVIQSATSVVGGGTTIVTMADLSRVQMRAFMNETDIGRIAADQEARVVVDAFPDRVFRGSVEKVEPQAVVQQSVTMFPVIISLPNNERLLLPGMNGEVSVNIERKLNVLAVPNDAVRSMRDAASAAELLGLDPEAVTEALRAARPADAGARATDTAAARTVAVTGSDSAGRATRTARPSGDTSAPTSEAAKPSSRTGASGRNAGTSRSGAGRGASDTRTGVVFIVADSGTYEPRLVRLGASDYDYSEVISGLQEGDKVASLAMAALQAAREARNARFSQMGGVPGLQRQTTTPGGGGGSGNGGGGGRGNF